MTPSATFIGSYEIFIFSDPQLSWAIVPASSGSLSVWPALIGTASRSHLMLPVFMSRVVPRALLASGHFCCFGRSLWVDVLEVLQQS